MLKEKNSFEWFIVCNKADESKMCTFLGNWFLRAHQDSSAAAMVQRHLYLLFPVRRFIPVHWTGAQSPIWSLFHHLENTEKNFRLVSNLTKIVSFNLHKYWAMLHHRWRTLHLPFLNFVPRMFAWSI